MRSTRTGHRWAAVMVAAMLMTLAASIASPAQTFKTLLTFDSTDGAGPEAPLLQASDGNLYGTTGSGGAYREGTVFKITPGSKLTTLYSFCPQRRCLDGSAPAAALVQASDGSLYGTTNGGGANDNGTVFRITSSGTLTTLYSFCSQTNCTDGAGSVAALIQGTDGSLYGTASHGGSPSYGDGVVFKITSSGTLTTLYSFCSQTNCTDGAQPYAALIQASDGNFYGTTYYGGANANGGPEEGGTVFKITTSGALTTLYSFCSQSGCTDGSNPLAGLVQGTDGNLYGATLYGGASNSCVSGNFAGCGTVFRITPSGALTTLYTFCSQTGCADGSNPDAALAQATDGNLYGTTRSGGNTACFEGCGTAFKITPSGTLTTLHSFCSQGNCADGEFPYAAPVQATNGSLYGTTGAGGFKGDYGTLFSLAVGLKPFVETNPTSGKVGRSVIILGNKLTGATSVTFNGIPATFTVELPTAIKATVPAGATTGPVQVVTPSGTLTSNVNFRVE